MNRSWNRRSAEVRVPSANIFSLRFSSFFDASVLERAKGRVVIRSVPHSDRPAGDARRYVTRVLKTRDERFVSAAYGLCRSSSTDDKPTRGDIRPLASVYLWCVAGRCCAATGSRVPREMPGSIGIACVESTIARDPLVRERELSCACARLALLIPVRDTYVRDPVYISNTAIFGNSAARRARQRATKRTLRSANTPPSMNRSRMQRIRGRTDHCDPPPPVIKLSSLNS